MNNIQVSDVNSLNKLDNKINSKLTTKPFLPTQKPDTFEKTKKSFDIDNAINELKEIKAYSFEKEPIFDDKQLEQIKGELSKSPEKYEPFKTIANSKFMKGDIACKLLKKDTDSLKELADITNIKNKDYFRTQRFEPEDLEKFANEFSAKELNRFKYIAEEIYDEDSVVELVKNKNLKNPEKVPAVIKEMKEKYYGKNSFKSVEFYGDFKDKKAFVCYAKLNNGKATQLFDSNLNRIALEETNEFKKNNNQYLTKKCVDYRTNTISKTTVKKHPTTTETELINEIRIIKNKNGKKVRTEYTTQSDVAGILNIKHVMPDGSEKVISSGSIDSNTGVTTIRKNMVSLDGTKTEYIFVEDKQGNRNSTYKIIDKNGKVLLDNNNKFEIINENKFISTNNNSKYEMTFTDKNVNIKNLNNGNNSTIEFEKLITGDKENAIKMIKKMSGEELLALNEKVKLLEVGDELRSSYDCKTNVMKSEISMGMLLHELGHAKDLTWNETNQKAEGFISLNKNVIKTYEKERNLFFKNYPITQRTHLSYFIGGKMNDLAELVAESNALINYHITDPLCSVRAQYLQQYFPRTIAQIAQELNK